MEAGEQTIFFGPPFQPAPLPAERSSPMLCSCRTSSGRVGAMAPPPPPAAPPPPAVTLAPKPATVAPECASVDSDASIDGCLAVSQVCRHMVCCGDVHGVMDMCTSAMQGPRACSGPWAH